MVTDWGNQVHIFNKVLACTKGELQCRKQKEKVYRHTLFIKEWWCWNLRLQLKALIKQVHTCNCCLVCCSEKWEVTAIYLLNFAIFPVMITQLDFVWSLAVANAASDPGSKSTSQIHCAENKLHVLWGRVLLATRLYKQEKLLKRNFNQVYLFYILQY